MKLQEYGYILPLFLCIYQFLLIWVRTEAKRLLNNMFWLVVIVNTIGDLISIGR